MPPLANTFHVRGALGGRLAYTTLDGARVELSQEQAANLGAWLSLYTDPALRDKALEAVQHEVFGQGRMQL